MNTTRISVVAAVISFSMLAGCKSGDKQAQTTRNARSQPAQREAAKKPVYTASMNPTTMAGRGTPSLDDQFRPAAWILVDEQEGKYMDVDGHPHLEWVINTPVSTSPTFRVEVFSPLLGEPDGFKAVLQSIETQDGSQIVYAFAAQPITDKDGNPVLDADGHPVPAFDPGRSYDLLNPGPNFLIRNLMTSDVVNEIGELPPGKYAFAGGVRNTKSGAETPAVTYFTVGN